MPTRLEHLLRLLLGRREVEVLVLVERDAGQVAVPVRERL